MKTEEALAIIGGHVDKELLLRNEYLAAENEILRSHNPRAAITFDHDDASFEIGEK